MKTTHHIQLVDSLAEITSHHDRELIEKSLLNTLSEYDGAEEFWLHRVISLEPEISLGLLAHLSKGLVNTTNYPKKYSFPEDIQGQIFTAIRTGEIEVFSPTKGEYRVIYPVSNTNDEIIAILIQNTDAINTDKQRLIQGLLRIYSNYLELIEQTKRDKLTGLLNRETLTNEITQLLIKNSAQNQPLSKQQSPYKNDQRKNNDQVAHWLGIIDIDHFKSVNDTYGHLYGDEILILVARSIESSIRDYDLAFRFGGEEFVVLLQAHDIEAAQTAFNRMRKMISGHTFAKIKTLTASIGITQITNQMGATDVLGGADQALYYAKENGRNKVCTYEQLVDESLIQASMGDDDKNTDTVFF
jgi:diguanylate cyclase (GGDEF)-like protein